MTTSSGPSTSAKSRLLVLLFTDLVGSTGLKDQLTTSGYLPLLRRHDELVREAIASTAGTLQQDTGDGCFAIFSTPSDAVRAALIIQWKLDAEPWPGGQRLLSRAGIHLGEVAETEVRQDGGQKLVGVAVDLAARVMSLAGGGQVLMTSGAFNDARQFVASHPIVGALPLQWVAHGPYLFKGIDAPVEVFAVGAGEVSLAPPVSSEKARRVVPHDLEETLGWRPAVGLEIPSRLDWSVKQKLGEGGFGEVWLAEHKKLRTRRVFKFCFDPERVRSFKREMTLFRLLREALGDRPDIARLYDVKLDEAPFFLESEFTDGGNLSDWAEAQGGISCVALETRLDFVARISEAVAAAHSVGVLHKDIKPSNILVYRDANGNALPRLSDFGIGILADRTEIAARNITETGFTILTQNDSSRTGTRMYAPPELMSGRPFTVQGDVYALGVLLYQMVTGDLHRPLAFGWERDIQDPLLREDIGSCVDGAPERRLVSPRALAERIRALHQRRQKLREAEEKLQAERQAEEERKQRLIRRRKRRIATIIAAAGMLIICTTGYLIDSRARARAMATLTRQLDEGLDAGDWSQAHVAALEDLVGRIGEITPSAQPAVRHRLYAKYAEAVGRSMQRTLSAEDVATMGLQIDQIAVAEPSVGTSLRKELADREAQWQPVFDVRAPFHDLQKIFKPVVPTADGAALLGTVNGQAASFQVDPALSIRGGQMLEADFTTPASPSSAPGSGSPPSSKLTLSINVTWNNPGYAFTLEDGTLTILRSGIALVHRAIAVSDATHIVASRDGVRLSVQVNSEPRLTFDDAFPIVSDPSSCFTVAWSPSLRLSRLRAFHHQAPAAPNPLEQGDALYAREAFPQALSEYASQMTSSTGEMRQEARYKQALCRLAMHNDEEAAAGFEQLAAEPGERWPPLAACNLWLLRLTSGHLDEANAVADSLLARSSFEQLMALVPDGVRLSILNRYADQLGMEFVTHRSADTRVIDHILLADAILGADAPRILIDKMHVVRAYANDGQLEKATQIAAQAVHQSARDLKGTELFEEYVSCLLMAGNGQKALAELDHFILVDGKLTDELKMRGLLVDRCRVKVSLGRMTEAEQDLNLYFRSVPVEVESYQNRAAACILKGLFLDDRGEHEAAQRIWRSCVVLLDGTAAPGADAFVAPQFGQVVSGGNFHGAVYAAILGGLTDTWTDAETHAMTQEFLTHFSRSVDNASPISALMTGMVSIPPTALRTVWRTPEGHQLAWELALWTAQRKKLGIDFVLGVAAEFMRLGTAEAGASSERQAVFHQMADDMLAAVAGKKLSRLQTVELLLAWKGSAGAMGWGAVAPSLPPPLRAELSYLMAERHLKISTPKQAKVFLDSALKDAAPASAVAKLSAKALEELAAGTTLPTTAPNTRPSN